MPTDDWINPISTALFQALPVILAVLCARLGLQLLPDGIRRQLLALPLVEMLTRPLITPPRE